MVSWLIDAVPLQTSLTLHAAFHEAQMYQEPQTPEKKLNYKCVLFSQWGKNHFTGHSRKTNKSEPFPELFVPVYGFNFLGFSPAWQYGLKYVLRTELSS